MATHFVVRRLDSETIHRMAPELSAFSRQAFAAGKRGVSGFAVKRPRGWSNELRAGFGGQFTRFQVASFVTQF